MRLSVIYKAFFVDFVFYFYRILVFGEFGVTIRIARFEQGVSVADKGKTLEAGNIGREIG
jgi:hypothetical protein